MRARARGFARRGTMGRARHRAGSSLKRTMRERKGCSTRSGRRRRAFLAVSSSEAVSKSSMEVKGGGKTHDGVC